MCQGFFCVFIWLISFISFKLIEYQLVNGYLSFSAVYVGKVWI